MAERLIIQNFAGLNLEIELGEITIFIGPQASGKSICARCLYWFKSFITELDRCLDAGLGKNEFDKIQLNRFREYFPNIWRNEKNFTLRYETGKIFIQISQSKQKITLLYSPAIQKAAAKFRTSKRNIVKKYSNTRVTSAIVQQSSSEGRKAHAFWLADIWGLADGNPMREQAFVLAGRSILSALQGSILTFLSTSPLKDPLMRDFLREYEIARQDQPNHNDPLLKNVNHIVESILKGRLIIQKSDDLLELPDGRIVPLAYSSSGQQEAFPLILFLLSYLIDFKREFSGQHILYIEEPEAHIFPDSQRSMAQLMSNVYNENILNLQYVITTHSPYLLASFNNLIYAHQLAERLHDQPKELKKLYKIVPKSQQIPLSDFRVYGLENGKAVSLIDHELGLISASLLDSASDVTADQFGDLMALDPTTKP